MRYLSGFLILFFTQMSFAQTTSFRYEGRLNGPTITPGAMPGQSFSVSLRRTDLCGGALGLSPSVSVVTLQNGAFSISPTFDSTLLARALDPWNNFAGACSVPYFQRQMVVTWNGESFPINIEDAPRANLATQAINSAKIGNVAVQTNLSCSANQLLKYNVGSSQLECAALASTDIPALLAASIPAFGGDVTGTISATSVDKIKGIAISGVPTNGQILKYNGSTWTPAADDTGGAPADASYAVKGVVQVDTSSAVSGLTISAGVLKLSNTAVTLGTYGDSHNSVQVTVDAQGRIQSIGQMAVDDTTKLPLFGGTMAGNINMGAHDVTNVTNVAATNASIRNLILNDNDTNTVTIKTPSDVTANYILTMPPDDGNAGQFLTTDGTGILTWTTPGASGITNLNGQSGAIQNFATGSSGTAPAFSSGSNLHTLNIPLASGAGVTSGTITKTEYDTFFAKLTSPLSNKGDILTRDGSIHVRLPVGTDSQILSADSSQSSGLKWINAPAGDITDVVAGTGLIGGASSGAASLAVNVGTSAGQIPQVQAGGKLPMLDGSLLTNLDAGQITTGNLQISHGGTGSSTAIGALNNFLPAQGGNAGKVLQTDGTNTSWATVGVGSVTNVSSSSSYLSVATGTTTPVITVNVGTAANTLAAGDDARINGALQTADYNADVASAGCTASQTPYWNGVGGVWMCQSIGNLSASAFTTGLVPSARLGSGTADATTYLRGDGQWAIPAGGVSPDATLAYRVRVATNSNITLSGLQMIDGVTVAANDRVLVKNQSIASENGIYTASSGGWVRSTDMDTWPETLGYEVQVIEGTTWAGARFVSTSNVTGTLGATAINWSSVASTANEDTAFGFQALSSLNSSVQHNTAIGNIALKNNTIGSSNTSIGSQSMNSNTTGSSNTAVGKNALGSNTTGSSNTVVGFQAGLSTIGSLNTFIGNGSGSAVGSGNNNVIIGSNNGSSIASSSNNIILSDGSGTIRMQVDNLGNVGIGTTTPTSLLDLNGAITHRGIASPGASPPGQGRIYFDSTSNTFKVSQNGSAYSDLLGSGGISTVTVTAPVTGGGTGGTVNIALDVTGTNGVVKNGGNSFSGGAKIGTSNPTNLELITASTTRMTVDNNGNVGVGVAPTSNVRFAVDGGLSLFAGSSPSPAVGQARMFFDSTSRRLKVSEDGGAYSNLLHSGSNASELTNDYFVENTFFNAAVAGASCTATQTLYWNSVGSVFQCQNIDSTNPGSFVKEGGNSISGSMTIGNNITAQPFYITNGGGTQFTILGDGKVGIGTTNPISRFQVQSNFVNVSGNAEGTRNTVIVNQSSTNHSGIYSAGITDFTLNGSMNINEANSSEIKTTNSSNGSLAESNSIKITSLKNGTGTTNSQRGITSFVQGNLGTITYADGIDSIVEANSLGAISNAVGISGQVSNATTTTMSTATALSAKVQNTGSSSITTGTGLDVSFNATTGSIGTAYGIKINTLIGTITNKYAIYQTGSSDKNVFQGITGLGMVPTGTYKLEVNGIIAPGADNTYDLGASGRRFANIYAGNGIINTSDVRQKKDIQNSDLGLDFVNNLRPVSYFWKEGDKKLHYGLIAQETEAVIAQAKNANNRGDEVDNVIVSHDEKTDAYGIRYTELISPLIKAVQELYAKIIGVEQKAATQDRAIASLAEENEKLKQENAEMKARLDKIEQMLKEK